MKHLLDYTEAMLKTFEIFLPNRDLTGMYPGKMKYFLIIPICIVQSYGSFSIIDITQLRQIVVKFLQCDWQLSH